MGSVDSIPPPPTLAFDTDSPKFNHLVSCGQGYDLPSLVTIGLELAPGRKLSTNIYTQCGWWTTTYWRRPKQNFPSPSVWEVNIYVVQLLMISVQI